MTCGLGDCDIGKRSGTCQRHKGLVIAIVRRLVTLVPDGRLGCGRIMTLYHTQHGKGDRGVMGYTIVHRTL